MEFYILLYIFYLLCDNRLTHGSYWIELIVGCWEVIDRKLISSVKERNKINSLNEFQLMLIDSHEIHSSKGAYECERVHNKENRLILTQKHRNARNVSVKREHQPIPKNCNSEEGFCQPSGKRSHPTAGTQ